MIMSKVNYSFQNKLSLGYTPLWRKYNFQLRVYSHLQSHSLKTFKILTFQIFSGISALFGVSPSLLKCQPRGRHSGSDRDWKDCCWRAMWAKSS
jgi:hypothetical protein